MHVVPRTFANAALARARVHKRACTRTHRGPPLHPQGQEPAGRLLGDGLMELTPPKPLYTRVDPSPDVAARQRRAGPTTTALNRQCISMRGSGRSPLSRVCVCVQGGGGVGGFDVWEDCNNAKHICRQHKRRPRGVCNPKPGANDYLPSPQALTQF